MIPPRVFCFTILRGPAFGRSPQDDAAEGGSGKLPPHGRVKPGHEGELRMDQFFGGGLEGVYCALGSLLVRSQPASPSQYGLMSSHTFGKVME